MDVSAILTFAILIGHRALSGLQNHYGYKRNKCFELYLTTAITMAYSIRAVQMWIAPASDFYIPQNDLVTKITASLLVAISVFGLYGVANSFKRVTKFPHRDIHLWETVTTTSFVLAAFAAGVDILYIALSVSPGMVLHKGLINIASSRPFIDASEITDDPTGRTFGIPSLDIAVRRFISNGWFRLAIATLAIAFVILNELYFKINFNIFFIRGWL